jgi:hypothetical protein
MQTFEAIFQFRLTAFEFKEQAPTPDDKQWLQPILTQPTDTVFTHVKAYMSRCIWHLAYDAAQLN